MGIFTSEITMSSNNEQIDIQQQQQPANDVLFPTWLHKNYYQNYMLFIQLFPELKMKLNLKNTTILVWWIKSLRCELEFPSFTENNKISSFQQLLIIKTFRPDRLYNAMEIYACKALKSLKSSSLNLHHLYMNETNNIEPILFITSAGSDPSIELENFAIEIVSSNKFKQLAMAGGNTQQALELIETAINGDWICLKNVHSYTLVT